MSDCYLEQLVKKRKTKKDSIRKAIYIIVEIILLTIIFQVFGFAAGFIPAFAVAFISFYLFNSRNNIEFEYAFTNGELDIDVIYNMSKRKRVFTGEVSEFEIMAHIDDEARLAPYESCKIKDFSSGEKLGNTYVFVTKSGTDRIKVIIEPKEELLKTMTQFIGRSKVFFK